MIHKNQQMKAWHEAKGEHASPAEIPVVFQDQETGGAEMLNFFADEQFLHPKVQQINGNVNLRIESDSDDGGYKKPVAKRRKKRVGNGASDDEMARNQGSDCNTEPEM